MEEGTVGSEVVQSLGELFSQPVIRQRVAVGEYGGIP